MRELQDSNLCGQSPSDFESDSLTTRTNARWSAVNFDALCIPVMRNASIEVAKKHDHL